MIVAAPWLSRFRQNLTAIQRMDEAASFLGMWVTADGRIRHELLPNGR